MPYKEKRVVKKYYTIGEVADIFKVQTSMIRYWEDVFGKLHAKISKTKGRVYTLDNIEKINKIYHYLKVELYTIKGVKRILDQTEIL